MTTIDPAHDAPVGDPPPSVEPRRAPLVVHLGLLLVVLLGVVAATSPRGSFVADDGSYQLQLRALDQGAWEWSTPGSDFDPDGSHHAIANADATDDGFAPFAKHPAWPWLAKQVSVVTGVQQAYAALGVVSILALAAVAWALAGLHDERWSRWAFWLAGTAPVAVTAAVPWAHAAGAAAAGLAVLGAARLVRRPTSIAAISLLGIGLAGATLLRTEGLLVAGAIALALVAGGRQVGRSWIWSVGAGGLTAALGVLVVRAEGVWIRSITGGGTATFQPRGDGGVEASGFLDARVQGTIRSLADSGRPSTTFLLAVAVIAGAITAWLAASGRPRMVTAWQIAAGGSVLILVLRVLSLSNYPVSGLLGAWPVAVAGVSAGLAVAWSRVRIEVTVVAISGAAILATQYADGGAGSWGGRFFALATAPLVVIAALGIDRLLTAAPEPSDRVITVRRFLIGLIVIPFLLGIAVVNQVQTTNADLYAWVDAQVDGVVITSAAELPRMMWRDDLPWLVVADDDQGDDFGNVLDHLAQEDVDAVSVVALSEHRGDVDAVVRARGEWTVEREAQRDGLEVLVLQR